MSDAAIAGGVAGVVEAIVAHLQKQAILSLQRGFEWSRAQNTWMLGAQTHVL